MGKRKHINSREFIEEAIENIKNDRALAMDLLVHLTGYMKASEERHQSCGVVAAKYLETLQRSNEQLVKLASLLNKKETSAATGLSTLEKSDIYDLINED
jgi:enoyl-[acyl-carrier-protein] reductase (NADH)